MENRRFILFIIGSIAIMLGSLWVQSKLRPPAPPAAPDQKQNQPLADKNAAGKPNAEVGKVAEVNPAAENVAAKAAEAPEAAMQWFTLGSGDPGPNNPYRLLVTLTNHGAAVERIELSSPDFRDLENRSGYLGHLAAEDSPQGVKVNIVAPGTPAAEAGLQPADSITAVNGKAIADAESLQAALKKTSPGEKIQLTISRGGQQQTLSTTLGRRPLEVVRPEKFTSDMLTPEPLDIVADNTHDPFSFLLTMWQLGDSKLSDRTPEEIKAAADDPSKIIGAELPGVKLRNANWDAKQIDADTVEFSRTLSSVGLQIVKRYKIAKVPITWLPPDSRSRIAKCRSIGAQACLSARRSHRFANRRLVVHQSAVAQLGRHRCARCSPLAARQRPGPDQPGTNGRRKTRSALSNGGGGFALGLCRRRCAVHRLGAAAGAHERSRTLASAN